MDRDDSKSHLSIDSIGPELVRDSKLQLNVKQTIIVVTEDKALLCIRDYEEDLGRNRQWIAPASVLIALVLALVSADFNETLGVPGSTWLALFWILAVGAGAWLVVSLFRIRRAATPSDVVRTLMAAGKVERISEGDVVEPFASISGTWSGHLLYGSDRSLATLILDESEGVVSGTLQLTTPKGSEVTQEVSGTYEEGWVTVTGEVIEGPETYSPDKLSVELAEDGYLKGACSDAQGESGQAQFKRKA